MLQRLQKDIFYYTPYSLISVSESYFHFLSDLTYIGSQLFMYKENLPIGRYGFERPSSR